MKICWDNLEKIRWDSKKKKWYNKYSHIIFYRNSCENCKEPFLSTSLDNLYCCISCGVSGEKNHFYKKGPMRGKKHSKETIKKFHNRFSNNKGAVKNNIPLYDTYAHQISYAEKVRRNKNNKDILEIKCTYCGKWHIPKRMDIVKRVVALNNYGGQRVYCSEECKHECPVYRKVKYSAEETNTKYLSREVQSQLRQLVFERDNWTCGECESTESLHCHHIEGIRWEPLESADIDKCLTRCKKCHILIHKKDGCKYHELRCNKKNLKGLK